MVLTAVKILHIKIFANLWGLCYLLLLLFVLIKWVREGIRFSSLTSHRLKKSMKISPLISHAAPQCSLLGCCHPVHDMPLVCPSAIWGCVAHGSIRGTERETCVDRHTCVGWHGINLWCTDYRSGLCFEIPLDLGMPIWDRLKRQQI